jgi:hypothetical protein
MVVYTERGWSLNGTRAKMRQTIASTVSDSERQRQFLATHSQRHFRISITRYPSSAFLRLAYQQMDACWSWFQGPRDAPVAAADHIFLASFSPLWTVTQLT